MLAFSIFNITLPDTYARVIVLIISGWFLYKYGSKTADIVVFLVLALAAATLLGFQVPALP